MMSENGAEESTVFSAVTRFIGVAIFLGSFCVADYGSNYTGVIKGKMN